MAYKHRIFLDLDGVVADFDAKFKQKFGMTADQADEKQILWKLMHNVQDFYLEMPLMPDAHELVAYLKSLEYPTIVLTAIPRRNTMPHVEEHKKTWVKENLGDLEFRIGPFSRDKVKHLEYSTDILIDDRRSNIEAWDAAGGIAIHHLNAAKTISILQGITKGL